MDSAARPSLFTVGHSNHELERFLGLLSQAGVTALADVRSEPHSRYAPQFDAECLSAALRDRGVLYVSLGRELGARREEPECYLGQQVQFDRVAEMPLFRQGLDRLRKGVATHRIALVCAEKDPVTCHRAILVCRNLRDDPIDIQHILADGSLENHAQLEKRLLRLYKLPEADLFRSREELLAEAYQRQGARIAYSADDALPAEEAYETP